MLHTNQLLDLSIKAAIKAAREILTVYGEAFEVEYKDDKSPLTLADKKSHDAIATVLSKTDYPLLSEEGKNIPYETRKAWKRFWLVDPLDGTKEFVKRNGEFTVNIALIEDGYPVLGVILVPVTGVLYFAEVGTGAYRATLSTEFTEAGGLPGLQRIPVMEAQTGSYRIVCSRSHMSPETAEYIEHLRPSHPELEFVSIGSSLKLCLIAEGKADQYPRFGPTMEWDTAAGHAIVEISGGYVHETKLGNRLMYNKENLLNPWFIAGRK